MSGKNKINRSIQFKNGSYSSILTIVVIAIVIVVNLAVNALPTEYTTFDTSGVDYYSITDTTKNMLKSLNKKVNIYMLSDNNGSYNEYVETMCGIFKDNSDKITFKKVDVAVEPGFVTQYNASAASGYSVIVEEPVSGRYKLIDFNSIYYSNSSYDSTGTSYYTYYYDGEGQLASAINYVTSDKSVMIYEMTGHGEQSLANYDVKDAFEKSNYSIAEEAVNLTKTDTIPEDCDVLFIFAPISDYSINETEIIKKYIANGGNTVVLFSKTAETDMTNFYSILEYIGISIPEGLIIEQDESHYYSASSYPQYTLIPDKKLNNSIMEGLENAYILSFYTSPVKQKETAACTSVYTELLKTSSNYQVVYFDDEYTVDYTEPASIATYVESTFVDTNSTAKTLVVGSSLFLQDLTGDNSITSNNSKLINNSIKEMVGDTASVYVEPKTLDEKFNVTTQSQVNLFSIFYLGLIPIAFLLGGVVVTVLRRSR